MGVPAIMVQKRVCFLLYVLLLWLFLLFFLLHFPPTEADPANLVRDSDFEEAMVFLDESRPWLEVVSDTPAAAGAIPRWTVVRGGVQLVSNRAYFPRSSSSNFSVHVNSAAAGPGTLHTTALASWPRRGAPYKVSYQIAANPDGGPLIRGLNVSVLVDNVVLLRAPPVSFSDPSAARNALDWALQSFVFIGTGSNTLLEFSSTTEGSYGLLIDDVKAELVNLVDNGSFELGTFAVENGSQVIMASPSTNIWRWLVSSGSIKYMRGWYNSSSDGSLGIVDLNGEEAGTITTSFATRKTHSYNVLFDYAGNPKASLPITGSFLIVLQDPDSGTIMGNQLISLSTYEWHTSMVTFVATGSYANVTFISQIMGTIGPLLDNVQAYEIDPSFVEANPSFSVRDAPARANMLWIFLVLTVMFILEYID